MTKEVRAFRQYVWGSKFIKHIKYRKNYPFNQTLTLLINFTIAERDILALKVKCSNSEKGCQWKGELRCLEEHIANDCDYTTVQCPNNCQAQIIRKHLKQHLECQCPKRQYSCPDCGEKGLYDEITTEHFQQCPNAFVKCPNRGCSYASWRSNFKLHKCLYELVPCKYYNIGCTERRIRKNIEAHEQDSVHHLHLTTEMVIQLQQEVAALKEENEMLAIDAKDNREAIKSSEETIGILYQQVQLNKEKLQHANSQTEELKQKIVSLQILTTNQCKVTFRLFPYSTYKETETDFDSGPFYSSTYGYKYSIQVYANGGTRGTHISVYASLLKGDHDDSLTWPFTGTFVIELLNQLEDKNHHKVRIKFPAESPVSKRVTNEEHEPSGYGRPEFIAHSDLSLQLEKPTQYLKNDMLIFHVSVEVPGFKPWLECNHCFSDCALCVSKLLRNST